MSDVIGIDLSTRAIHLARLGEDDPTAWVSLIEIPGRDAWTRTLTLGRLMPPASWWDDVYLVAIEAPYGTGQAGTLAVLNRIVGAIVAQLPAELRSPERCWIVRPDEWKSALGLSVRAKPTIADIERVGLNLRSVAPSDQNARDATCIALFARNTNAKGVAAA